jgi:hypothetical protein
MKIGTSIPGTLDSLILKAVSLQRHHGYGVMERIQSRRPHPRGQS